MFVVLLCVGCLFACGVVGRVWLLVVCWFVGWLVARSCVVIVCLVVWLVVGGLLVCLLDWFVSYVCVSLVGWVGDCLRV